MSYHWNPFDFTTDPARVTPRMHQLLSVRSIRITSGAEFHAFTEMLRKALLAAPLVRCCGCRGRATLMTRHIR